MNVDNPAPLPEIFPLSTSVVTSEYTTLSWCEKYRKNAMRQLTIVMSRAAPITTTEILWAFQNPPPSKSSGQGSTTLASAILQVAQSTFTLLELESDSNITWEANFPSQP